MRFILVYLSHLLLSSVTLSTTVLDQTELTSHYKATNDCKRPPKHLLCATTTFSVLDCAAVCSRTSGCSALKACTDLYSSIKCRLIGDFAENSCSEIVTHSNCRFMQISQAASVTDSSTTATTPLQHLNKTTSEVNMTWNHTKGLNSTVTTPKPSGSESPVPSTDGSTTATTPLQHLNKTTSEVNIAWNHTKGLNSTVTTPKPSGSQSPVPSTDSSTTATTPLKYLNKNASGESMSWNHTKGLNSTVTRPTTHGSESHVPSTTATSPQHVTSPTPSVSLSHVPSTDSSTTATSPKHVTSPTPSVSQSHVPSTKSSTTSTSVTNPTTHGSESHVPSTDSSTTATSLQHATSPKPYGSESHAHSGDSSTTATTLRHSTKPTKPPKSTKANRPTSRRPKDHTSLGASSTTATTVQHRTKHHRKHLKPTTATTVHHRRKHRKHLKPTTATIVHHRKIYHRKHHSKPTKHPKSTKPKRPKPRRPKAHLPYNSCLNGGKYSYAKRKCQCYPGYAGKHCTRRIRSCREAYLLGVRGMGFYKIKPLASPKTYTVYCNCEWVGTIYAFKRVIPPPPYCRAISYDRSWKEYRDGFGDIECGEYFLGLETIYQLTMFEKLQWNIYNLVDGEPFKVASIYLENTVLGPESTGYMLNYDRYFTLPEEHGDDYFQSREKPRRFCTYDRDCYGCAGQERAGWWFTRKCEGGALTAKPDMMYWPVYRQFKVINQTFLQLDHMEYF